MGLDSDAVRDALTAERATFGRWEDLTGEARERVMRAVWDRVTDGAAYPW
jgi:hypothetical protein